MKNLRIYMPLVDGSEWDVKLQSGQELIHRMVGDDVRPPPRSLQIEGVTGDGRRVRIGVPYNDRDEVSVTIDGT